MNTNNYQIQVSSFISEKQINPTLVAATEFNTYLQTEADALLLRMHCRLASDEPKEECFQYPSTWKDAMLDRFVPAWIQKRIRFLQPAFTYHSILTNYVYPNLQLPPVKKFERIVLTDHHKWQGPNDYSEDPK